MACKRLKTQYAKLCCTNPFAGQHASVTRRRGFTYPCVRDKDAPVRPLFVNGILITSKKRIGIGQYLSEATGKTIRSNTWCLTTELVLTNQCACIPPILSCTVSSHISGLSNGVGGATAIKPDDLMVSEYGSSSSSACAAPCRRLQPHDGD